MFQSDLVLNPKDRFCSVKAQILEHRGESHDLRTTTMVDTIEKSVDSGKAFFGTSFNTDQIFTGFEAVTQEK